MSSPARASEPCRAVESGSVQASGGRSAGPVCRAWRRGLPARRNSAPLGIGQHGGDRIHVSDNWRGAGKVLRGGDQARKAGLQALREGGVARPRSARIIEKGLVSDRVVIDTVVAKYSAHCRCPPERPGTRTGVRSAGRRWMDGDAGGQLLVPIAAVMGRELLAAVTFRR